MAPRLRGWSVQASRLHYGPFTVIVLAFVFFLLAHADRIQAAKASWFVLPNDLGELAKKAPPPTAKLFQTLSVPSDRITVKDATWSLVPLVFFPEKGSADNAGKLIVERLDVAKGKPLEIALNEFADFVPYEQTAHETIAAFLGQAPNLEQLTAAETALKAVLRFHHATRATANKNEWRPFHYKLDEQLRDVCLQRLQRLGEDAEGLPQALAYGEELRTSFRHQRKLSEQLRVLWTQAAERALSAGDLLGARKFLDRIDEEFADDAEPHKVRAALQERAAALLKEAEPLTPAAAVVKLREAFALWPRLVGLGDALAKHEYGDRVLYVGVPALPDALSPEMASTDVEIAAGELLFEGLFRSVDSEKLGHRYGPALAVELPAAEAGQRRVQLRHNACWSNGERLTAVDVRHTAQTFLPPTWHALIERPHLDASPFHVNFRLRQGLFDPLGLLSFKVLPQSFRGKPLQRGDVDFARNPVGSGPYVYRGRFEEGGRSYAGFLANPNYLPLKQGAYAPRSPAHAVTPIIREIRFFVWPEASSANVTADLLLDVPAERLTEIRKSELYRVHTLLPKRIHILAVNQRAAPLASENVRRALAHIIDRDEILTGVYRRPYPELPFLGTGNAALSLAFQAEQKKLSAWHCPLNGPFPPDSWACCPPPRVPERLHNVELAKGLLQKAADQLQGQVITLKYPLYDPRTAAACEAIAAQVNRFADEAGVKFRLQCAGLPPAELVKALNDRDYELAWMQHDFQDETFWLGPWFDESAEALAKGGSNVLGYENDSTLLSLLRSALAQRQFSALQETTHALHARLHEKMPFIPLWQLHRTVAVHRDLTLAPLDATRVFDHIERWRFKAK